MVSMLLGDTVAKVCTSPRNSTWFTRPFLLVRGRGLGMRLQATMHYLLHNHMYIQICVYKEMHAYLCKEPKGDHYVLFVGQKLLYKKCMVSFIFQTLNLSSAEKFRAIPICFTVSSLVNQTLTCSLITMGRFKFMDNNFSLNANNVTNMNYNLISIALKF